MIPTILNGLLLIAVGMCIGGSISTGDSRLGEGFGGVLIVLLAFVWLGIFLASLK